MSAEDAQQALSELGIANWDGEFQNMMNSAKWQEKVDALTALGSALQASNNGGQFSAPLVVYLNAKNSGFKISNANILKAVIQVACSAAQHAGSVKFSKAAAWTLLNAFGDKLSDKKTKDLVQSLLTALSECLGPSFIVKRMKLVMDKVKAPLGHQHYLEWLKVAVAEFGAGSFPVPFVGSFCQEELENKIAAVRTAAVEVRCSP